MSKKYCDEHFDKGVERCPFMDFECCKVLNDTTMFNFTCLAPGFAKPVHVLTVSYDGKTGLPVDITVVDDKKCPLAEWKWQV